MKNNKRIIVLTIIGVVALLISILGATYAYFVVGTTNNFKTPKIEASTGELGSVTLQTGSNLYLNLTRVNMSEENQGSYYATKSEEGSASTTIQSVTIGKTNVEGNGTYNCNYTLKVTNEGTLKEALTESGVVTLVVGGQKYDVYSTSFPLTISGTLNGLTEKNSEAIKAYLEFKNTDKEQNAIANKNMTLTFSATTFSCTAEENESTTLVNKLINNVSSDVLWESTLEDDGYRFVGTDPNNYICFGTSDKDACTSDTDKYMYRIIGIFEDEAGNKHAKLIKKEALNTAYVWNSDYFTDVDWNNSDLYKGLNGSYFLTNTSYPYMQDAEWTDKISTWNYTMTNTKSYENYSTNSVYGPDYNYETGKTMYLHELNRNGKANESCYWSSSTSADCNVGEWKNLSTKISLMYASDYALSLGSDALSYTSYSNYSTLKTGWMHISNNDSGTPSSYEWTMSRYGKLSNGVYRAWYVYSNGSVNYDGVYNTFAVRPVFYLESNVELATKSGDGSITNPYLIK